MRRASLGVGSRAAIILLPVRLANPRLVALAPPGLRCGWRPGGPGAPEAANVNAKMGQEAV